MYRLQVVAEVPQTGWEAFVSHPESQTWKTSNRLFNADLVFQHLSFSSRLYCLVNIAGDFLSCTLQMSTFTPSHVFLNVSCVCMWGGAEVHPKLLFHPHLLCKQQMCPWGAVITPSVEKPSSLMAQNHGAYMNVLWLLLLFWVIRTKWRRPALESDEPCMMLKESVFVTQVWTVVQVKRRNELGMLGSVMCSCVLLLLLLCDVCMFAVDLCCNITQHIHVESDGF